MYVLKNESGVLTECPVSIEYDEAQRAWYDSVRDIYFVDAARAYTVEQVPDPVPVTDGGPSVTG